MAIQVERHSGAAERQVLVGMSASRTVLGAVAARWTPGLFPSKLGQLVGGWCVAHWAKYRRPPGAALEHYYAEWVAGGRDRDTVELVDRFLAGVADEYAAMRRAVIPEHLLDVAGRLFEKHALADLRDQIGARLEIGDLAAARDLVAKSRRVEIGAGTGISVLAEDAHWEAMMARRDESPTLIRYPGALGNFWANTLAPDSFIAFMAPEKCGKSFYLQDMAWRAVEQQRNVAYFEVGDLSQPQVLARFAARMCGRPLDARRYDYPVALDPAPSRDFTSLAEVRHESRETQRPLAVEEILAARVRWAERVGADRFRLSCHPNSSISVAGIEGILDGWEQNDGWVPAVTIIDYPDILAPLNAKEDKRERINETWKALRALSQRRHCLVVAVTQTDTDAYDVRILRRDNFSEDHRKFAHVTGMVGINQRPAEKERGLYRLNWILARELDFSPETCCWTAASLSTAEPAVLSIF